MTFQGGQCEVLALRKCCANLANVMEQFCRQIKKYSMRTLSSEIQPKTQTKIAEFFFYDIIEELINNVRSIRSKCHTRGSDDYQYVSISKNKMQFKNE